MLSLLGPMADLIHDQLDRNRYNAGFAAGLLIKEAAAPPTSVYALSGELYVSDSGWLLLSVPNSLVRGLFAALDLPGVELPPGRPNFNAHVSVMNKTEVEAIGADRISERGKRFRYQIGAIKTCDPKGWDEMSAVYFVEVQSPELKALRRSYGLSALPRGDHEFHVSVAVKRKGVMAGNGTSKAAAGLPVAGFVSRESHEAVCPHCGGEMDEKALVPNWDHEAGVMGPGYRHRGPCYDKGPFEVRWPEKKAASRETDERGEPCPAGECCPNCGARLERGDDGDCNRCGEPWPRFFCESCREPYEAEPDAGKCPKCSGDIVPDTYCNRQKYKEAAVAGDEASRRLVREILSEARPSAAGLALLKAAGDAAARVKAVVKAIDPHDLYGAWYNPAAGKARVSLGDWSETSYRDVEASLATILGAGNVEVDAELGQPEPFAGWKKLGARPSIDRLLEAKAQSDRKNYDAKHAILRAMIGEDPDAFDVDSRLGGMVGITHKATGFRLHCPASLLKAAEYGKEAAGPADLARHLGGAARSFVGRSLAGGTVGLAAGAGELASGIADPNMSLEGKLSLLGANALGGATLANPRARRALFTKPSYKAIRSPGTIPRYIRQDVPAVGRMVGATALATGLPKLINATDITARVARKAQDSWQNDPAAMRAVSDPSTYGAEVMAKAYGDVAKETLASPTTQEAGRAFGRTLGAGLAGLGGGGLVGHLAGSGLGRLFQPDDAALSYEDRRARERNRIALDLAGTTLGSAAGAYGFQQLAQKHAAGPADLIANIGRAALGYASRAPAAIGRAAAPTSRFVRSTASGLGNAGRSSLAAASRLPARASETAKFVAGVPANQPFAATPLAGARNVANIAFKPRYPGLDRTPGLATEARAFDKTRAALGTAARGAGVASLGLSAAVAVPGLLRRYPDFAADNIGRVASMPRDEVEALKAKARANAPSFYFNLAKQWVGLGDDSAFSRMHGAVAGEAALPLLRNDIYEARRSRPVTFGVSDTLRSLTPAGALMTAGIRAFGSPEAPDLRAIVNRHRHAFANEIAADPRGTRDSPFAAIYQDIAPPVVDSLSKTPAWPFRSDSGYSPWAADR